MGYFSNQYYEVDKMWGMALSVFYASFFFKLYLNFLPRTITFDCNINAEKHPHQQRRDSFQCVFGSACLKLSIKILQTPRWGYFCLFISRRGRKSRLRHSFIPLTNNQRIKNTSHLIHTNCVPGNLQSTLHKIVPLNGSQQSHEVSTIIITFLLQGERLGTEGWRG